MAENDSYAPLYCHFLLQQHARGTNRDSEKGTKFESTACFSTESLSGTGSFCFHLKNPVPLAQTELPSCSEFGHHWSDAGDEMVFTQGCSTWGSNSASFCSERWGGEFQGRISFRKCRLFSPPGLYDLVEQSFAQCL